MTSSQREAIAAVFPECSQTSTPNTGWWAASRREACTHAQFDILVFQIPSGIIVGTANMHATLDLTASTTAAGWSSKIYLWVWDATGIGFPESATGNLFGCAGCVGTSSVTHPSFDAWRGTGSFGKTVPTGAIESGLGGFWQMTLRSSRWPNGLTVYFDFPAYRCDNAIGNRLAGCVFSSIPGAVGFFQTRNPDFVWHVYLAQLSGLPGRLTTGTYLTKLTGGALVSKNGTTACPPSLVRPVGYQCDEYPFRSTYQGAFTAGVGVARGPDWCMMPDPYRTGPIGWSRCFIPQRQNSSAGGLLVAFYGNERILDGDPFQVGYLP